MQNGGRKLEQHHCHLPLIKGIISEIVRMQKGGRPLEQHHCHLALIKNIILEIVRVQNGGRPPGREIRLLDVYNERPVRVSAKVLVPVKEHPKVFTNEYSRIG